MLHKSRRWCVGKVTQAELVEKLRDHDWTGCTAFQTEAGTIWASDSFDGGIQEFAPLRKIDGAWRQVESITTSWCDEAKLGGYVAAADRGDWDANAFDTIDAERFDFDKHETCARCA